MASPLAPILSKYVEDEWVRLEHQQITPWAFLTARQPFRVQDFYGRTIAYQGVAFEGSLRQLFWGRYIEPFLENIVHKTMEEALRVAAERKQNAREPLLEVAGILKSLVRRAFRRMAEIDRRLRGKGYPSSVPLRSVDAEVEEVERFIDERLAAELRMLEGCATARNAMTTRQEFVVYLSSTLADLALEREVALRTIAEFARVATSFRASEEGVVTTCTSDVRKCNLYIGILGQRYGYVPLVDESNPEEKSITELEYDVCRTPGQPPIPRLMFIKSTEAGIAAAHIDALSNKTSAARMEAFLNRAGKDQTAYVFKNLDDFRSELRVRVKDHADQFHQENERNVTALPAGPRAVLRWPGAQDFSGYLAAKREGFVGREWLFKRVISWAASGTSHSMLIIGAPGLGKSAIVAEMVEHHEAMGVIAWFCCRWDYSDQLAPRVFVEAIAASLAENLPAYAQTLAAPELQTLLEKAQTGSEVGPRTLFEQLVLLPLAKLPDPPPAQTHFDRCA